jgi:hypothetical protein
MRRARGPWPEDWLEAIQDEKCSWLCVKARDDICVCRCRGRYHNALRDEASLFGKTIEQYMEPEAWSWARG